MKILVKALTEIWGLFVDDGALAAALVVWCALAWWGLPNLAVGKAWGGPILFVGCLVILFIDVVNSARRQGTARSPTQTL